MSSLLNVNVPVQLLEIEYVAVEVPVEMVPLKLQVHDTLRVPCPSAMI
jgi:hypothetical protein